MDAFAAGRRHRRRTLSVLIENAIFELSQDDGDGGARYYSKSTASAVTMPETIYDYAPPSRMTNSKPCPRCLFFEQ